MAIAKYDFKENVPKSRDDQGIKDESGEDMSLSAILVRALDDVDMRKQNPQTGLPMGVESVGDIRKRIALSDKIEGMSEDTLVLETPEVDLLEKVVTSFFNPKIATLVIRALDDCKVKEH